MSYYQSLSYITRTATTATTAATTAIAATTTTATVTAATATTVTTTKATATNLQEMCKLFLQTRKEGKKQEMVCAFAVVCAFLANTLQG